MIYDWQEALRKMQHQPHPPADQAQKAQAEEQSEVVENTAMWRAAANLTQNEYAYARWLKLQRERGNREG